MFKRIARRFVSFVLVIVLVLSVIPAVAYAANVNTGVDGLTANSSGDATWTYNSSTITGSVKASSSSGCTGTTYTSQNGTLTFTNSSGAVGLLSFDFSITLSNGSVTIDGTDITASGSFSKTLNAGGTVAVRIASNETNTTATTISISNIKLTPETDVNVTFKAPEHGTYTVNGDEISAETTRTFKTTDSVVLSAAPANGYKFLGWYNVSSSEYFDLDAATSKSFTEETTVEPHFVVNTLPVFQVGTKVFTDLNEAVSYSQSSGIDKIVLISDGTLPSGSYKIPNGKVLLIPFDEGYSLVKETPTVIWRNSANLHVMPTAFKTLTMADGAIITVQNGGSISIASELDAAGQMGGWNGTPTGPDGRINMLSGSNITLQSGGKLYCWGYIYGNGSITALSGSTVHEAFQIKDWRGGTATSNCYDYTFILSQYYIQNIEVPLTIHAGATEKLYSSANASSKAYPMGATLVGSGGMFNVQDGYIVKDYIESTDRLQIDINGDASITPMTLTGLPLIGSISTDEFELPITSNFSLNINSGTTTVTQKIKLLPGVEIGIKEGASLSINSGKKVYVYDNDDWGNFTGNARLYPIGYSVANGTTAKRNAASLTDAKLDVNGNVSVSGSLYTSRGGANITSSNKSGTITLLTANSTNSEIYEMANNSTKTEVVFNPAKLHNGDDTYTQTSGASAGQKYSYCAVHDKWELGDPHEAAYNLDRWEWAEDYSAASAVFKIQGSDVEETKEATVAETVITPATCDTSGQKIVTATVEFNGDTYTSEEITVDVQPLGHTWQFVDFTWTETESGYTADANYKCSRDETHTNTVAAEIISTTTDATCTEADSVTYSATVSAAASLDGNAQSDTKTVTGSALGHNMEHQEANNATCTVDGNSEYWHCIRCGKYYSDANGANEITEGSWIIQALGHNYQSVVTEPTCTEAGYATHTCSRCNDSYVDSYVEALGHDWSEWAVTTAPTCTDAGVETRECSRCDATETRAVDALGHTAAEAVEENRVEPTCTEPGHYDSVVYCSVCNGQLSRTEVEIEALGHNYEAVVTNPTCTEQGYTTHTCSRCNDSYVDSYVEALGHDWSEWVVTTAPTCTGEGVETRTCSRCDATETRAVDAIGHTAAEAVEENRVEPTCTEPGHYDSVVYCSVCNAQLSRTEVEIEALGHNYEAVVTNPTCTEQGYTTHTCSRCNDSYKADYVEALGHDWSEWAVTTAPTCTDAGVETRECSRCDATETRPVEALGHTAAAAVVENRVEPTCSAEGSYDEVVYCSVCHEELSRTPKTIEKIAHTPAEAVRENEVAATCSAEGSYDEVVYCSVCHEELSRTPKTIDALGHDFGEWTVTTEPTCTEEGVETRYCSRCDATETRPVAELGHDYHAVVTDPTCTEQGYTTHTCSRCNDNYVDNYVDALGHDFGEWTETTAPTCTEEGVETRYCSRCDAFETRPVEALGHDYVGVTTAPTCTAQGYTTYTCSRCGDNYVDDYVDALGHDFGEWTETTAPTCTEAGEETRYCSRCDAFETRPVAALGHDYVPVVTSPPCAAQG